MCFVCHDMGKPIYSTDILKVDDRVEIDEAPRYVFSLQRRPICMAIRKYMWS